MRFRRAVSVALLLVLVPMLGLRPAAIDALLIHAHDHDDLHAHAIARLGSALPAVRPAVHTHDDHDHGHSHGPSLSSSTEGAGGPEIVVVFPKDLLLVAKAAPLRLVANERPVPPWLGPFLFQNEPDNAHLPFATGPPPNDDAFHCALRKTAALLLLNHALLL